MEKIKPEVIAVRRVFASGRIGFSFEMARLVEMSNVPNRNRDVLIHPNGKPKFRLVYKNTKLPTLK